MITLVSQAIMMNLTTADVNESLVDVNDGSKPIAISSLASLRIVEPEESVVSFLSIINVTTLAHLTVAILGNCGLSEEGVAFLTPTIDILLPRHVPRTLVLGWGCCTNEIVFDFYSGEGTHEEEAPFRLECNWESMQLVGELLDAIQAETIIVIRALNDDDIPKEWEPGPSAGEPPIILDPFLTMSVGSDVIFGYVRKMVIRETYFTGDVVECVEALCRKDCENSEVRNNSEYDQTVNAQGHTNGLEVLRVLDSNGLNPSLVARLRRIAPQFVWDERGIVD
jgi:hypothetical protein